ncbi:hypothetical protein AAMO2058_000173500 [Amorphochlora amoebiformis]
MGLRASAWLVVLFLSYRTGLSKSNNQSIDEEYPSGMTKEQLAKRYPTYASIPKPTLERGQRVMYRGKLAVVSTVDWTGLSYCLTFPDDPDRLVNTPWRSKHIATIPEENKENRQDKEKQWNNEKQPKSVQEEELLLVDEGEMPTASPTRPSDPRKTRRRKNWKRHKRRGLQTTCAGRSGRRPQCSSDPYFDFDFLRGGSNVATPVRKPRRRLQDENDEWSTGEEEEEIGVACDLRLSLVDDCQFDGIRVRTEPKADAPTTGAHVAHDGRCVNVDRRVESPDGQVYYRLKPHTLGYPGWVISRNPDNYHLQILTPLRHTPPPKNEETPSHVPPVRLRSLDRPPVALRMSPASSAVLRALGGANLTRQARRWMEAGARALRRPLEERVGEAVQLDIRSGKSTGVGAGCIEFHANSEATVRVSGICFDGRIARSQLRNLSMKGFLPILGDRIRETMVDKPRRESKRTQARERFEDLVTSLEQSTSPLSNISEDVLEARTIYAKLDAIGESLRSLSACVSPSPVAVKGSERQGRDVRAWSGRNRRHGRLRPQLRSTNSLRDRPRYGNRGAYSAGRIMGRGSSGKRRKPPVNSP